MIETKIKEPLPESSPKDEEAKKIDPTSTQKTDALSDEEYWEEQIFISRGPAGWNIGCGCG